MPPSFNLHADERSDCSQKHASQNRNVIIDAHVHCYDPNRPQGIPHPQPDNTLLYRPMLPVNLKATAKPAGVTGAVFIECSPWVEDNQWALDLAENEPFLQAVVGHLNPVADNFPALLDRFSAHPLFRGIRSRPLEFDDARLRPRLQRLAKSNLSLDVLLRPLDLPRLGLLARDLPDLRIMIDHLGHPSISGGAPDPAWLDALPVFSDLPNVYCKISALAEASQHQPAPSAVAYYAPIIAAAENVFGPDRLVFASNWPPCLQACEYSTTVRLVQDYFSARPEVAAKVLMRNAARFYGGPRLATVTG
jgi:L-fuconolactonase